MRFFIFLNLLFISSIGFSQEIQKDSIAKKLDLLYREDQFYISFAYNNLQNKPNGLTQGKFSPELRVGFLRDMPFNKNRTWAIAAGFGYSLNIYNSNLQTYIQDFGNGKVRTYSILESGDFYDKNKLSLHYLDIPIELRWRTSTPETHRFWRIYTGFKFSYLIADKYKFEGNGITIKDSGNKDLNKFQYGAYFATGWNTWNAYVFYRLNPIYKSAEIDGNKVDLTSINFGLMFYIL
jgi:hypothetical protein